MIHEKTVYSRAGLVGNPSDGYYGKTISTIIKNFSAKVTLYESPEIEIIPSIQDEMKYNNLDDLMLDVKNNGYYGGLRLLKGAVKKFYDYCKENQISIDQRNFSIRYETDIPRRLGLAGSSALVTATMKCLIEFYGVHIPKPILPNLILSVETEELDIAAGLQDRVIQVYEGVVFMDFDKNLLDDRGYGKYESIDITLLPQLFLAYRNDLGEGSETIHQTVHDRWLEGDTGIISAMEDIAGYAQEARDKIIDGKGEEIGELLDKNFNRRLDIFKVSSENIEMVDIARSIGAHAKLSGSGGAIIGIYEDENMYNELEKRMKQKGIVVIKPKLQ